MALFGERRDISLLRHLNRELMGNIISQECAYYKYDIEQTNTNIYGESSTKRILKEPILLNALIARNNQEYPIDELGVDFKWDMSFAFLRDDLVDINLVPEIGDIIMYYEGYFEVINLNENRYFMGKNPDYPYDPNILNPELQRFGYDVHIVCKTIIVPADKIDVVRTR